MMNLENPICLGGGHGVRAYLPQDLQRFSIDLDFYTNDADIQNTPKNIGKFPSLKPVGYRIESEGKFKRYDSALPASLKKCTIAFFRPYNQ